MLRDICQAVAIPVQIGGGVRTMPDIEAVLELGAARAILGTAAALDPAFVARAVEEFAERVLVAVDVRGGHVMVKGWQEEGPELEPTIEALDEAGRARVTSSRRSPATARSTGPTSVSTSRCSR